MKLFRCFWILFLPLLATGQVITTYSGSSGGALVLPENISFDRHGNLFIADLTANEIKKIDTTGIVRVVAGRGSAGFFGDGGPATLALLNNPSCAICDTVGNVYITDNANNRIRKIDITTGLITTIAGSSAAAYTGDNGPASAAKLSSPCDLCFDKHGNLFIIDAGNYVIRKIDTSGIITTIAGNGNRGYSGDGGPATNAMCNPNSGICINSVGDIFFCDAFNSTVRKIDTSGNISTVAGDTSGAVIYTGDGVPALGAPMGVTCATLNNIDLLTISDELNSRVYQVNSSGIFYTIAGKGIRGYSGDGGPPDSAELSQPTGLAYDQCGNLYIGQVTHACIREVTFPPTILLSGTTGAAPGSPVTLTATIGGDTSYTIYWMNDGVVFDSTTTSSVTYTKTSGTDTITALVIPRAPYRCYDSTTSSSHIVSAVTTGSIVPLKPTVVVFPNPVSGGLLHINSISSACSYQLSNAIGTVQIEGTLKQGNNAISVQTLSPGIYMLQLTDENGNKIVKKIIKE